MPSFASFTLLSCAVFAGAVLACGAFMLVAIEVDRLRARRLLAASLSKPHSVERAWVSRPDEDGLRRLVVKPVGVARARAVALDADIEELLQHFTLAGIRVGDEREGVAA